MCTHTPKRPADLGRGSDNGFKPGMVPCPKSANGRRGHLALKVISCLARWKVFTQSPKLAHRDLVAFKTSFGGVERTHILQRRALWPAGCRLACGAWPQRGPGAGHPSRSRRCHARSRIGDSCLPARMPIERFTVKPSCTRQATSGSNVCIGFMAGRYARPLVVANIKVVRPHYPYIRRSDRYLYAQRITTWLSQVHTDSFRRCKSRIRGPTNHSNSRNVSRRYRR